MRYSSSKEIWRPIAGYEGVYEVSSFGRVKSLARMVKRPTAHDQPIKERIMVQRIGTNGYPKVQLYESKGVRIKKDFGVHRLVAQAFLENPENKKCIDHLDGNKLNNNVNNLEWVTYRENNIRAYETGLKRRIHGGQFVKGGIPWNKGLRKSSKSPNTQEG